MEESDIVSSDKEAKLYIVATPIGNLKDITIRALEILKEVHIVYAEDTRNSKTLFNHYEISTPLISYHQHNEQSRIQEIIHHLQKGQDIALISDAGTPLINDPGSVLVHSVIQEGFDVVSIPGASAFLTALVASGLPTHPFLFYGFLPAKKKEKLEVLNTLKTSPNTLIFYEAPHRIEATINDLKETFVQRNVVIGRELTKKFESYYRGDLESIKIDFPLKGEFVIILEGFIKDEEIYSDTDLIDHIELCIQDGYSEMDAIKLVAKSRKLKKNVVYMTYKTHKKHFMQNEEE